MDENVKQFIESNIKLIEKGMWEEVYKCAANMKYGPYFIGQLTSILLGADLHPEYDLHEIPANFLRASDIESFTIPSNAQAIGMCAFEECSELTNIIVPANIEILDYSAFNRCVKLESVRIIGNNLQRINGHAFDDCKSLRSIDIPSSVVSIHDSAFNGCKDLIINYSGTTSDWHEIYLDYHNNPGTSNNAGFTVHCIDGEILSDRKRRL